MEIDTLVTGPIEQQIDAHKRNVLLDIEDVRTHIK